MTYRVEISPAAARDLKRLPPGILPRIEPVILGLADEPCPIGSRKIRGAERAYRARVGEYRVIYEIRENDKLVVVLRVTRRSESTYRGL